LVSLTSLFLNLFSFLFSQLYHSYPRSHPTPFHFCTHCSI
jgi:hypothetical protein